MSSIILSRYLECDVIKIPVDVMVYICQMNGWMDGWMDGWIDIVIMSFQTRKMVSN